VSLIQALTQIQEQTLPFAIKLVAVVVVMIATAPWLGAQMQEYTLRIFDQFPVLVR
jgi:type III secretion protein S